MRNIRNMTTAAVMLALGQVLPFITGQIPQIGARLSPMHLPVLLCGFAAGPAWGAVVGFICPLLRSVLFGMPPIFPTATAMAFELCTYGFISGFLFQNAKKQNLVSVYTSLIGAMLAGRVVWGIVQYILLTATKSTFTFQAFLAGAFINAVPAIILQLVLIPVLVMALGKSGLIKLRQ